MKPEPAPNSNSDQNSYPKLKPMDTRNPIDNSKPKFFLQTSNSIPATKKDHAASGKAPARSQLARGGAGAGRLRRARRRCGAWPGEGGVPARGEAGGRLRRAGRHARCRRGARPGGHRRRACGARATPWQLESGGVRTGRRWGGRLGEQLRFI